MKLKQFLTPVLAVFATIGTALFFIARFFLVKEPRSEGEFPLTKEKEKLEQEKQQTEKELEELNGKEYTKEEIEKKFNS